MTFENSPVPDPEEQAEEAVGRSLDNPWTMPDIVRDLLPTPSPEEQAQRVFDLTDEAMFSDGFVNHHAGRVDLTHPSMRPEYRQRMEEDHK